MTSFEVEDFPMCVGCVYFVKYECTNKRKKDEKPLDLVDCYQGKDGKLDFINPKFEKWWITNLRDSN